MNDAIDAFLRRPSDGIYSLKDYPSGTDARADYIKTLERFLLTQGLDTKAVYTLPQTHTTFHIPQHIDEPYDQVVHEAGGGLYSYPVPRAQHTADLEVPFCPENEGMFESTFMKQMAREGRAPAFEDLQAMARLFQAMGIPLPPGVFPHGL